MPESPTSPSVEGILDRIVYSNEETAWSVVRLVVPSRVDPVTAVGNLPGVQPGETLRLQGEWVKDRRFGEQFKVSSFTTVRPDSLVGIEKYLGSGMVRGLGPVMAGRLVEKFGDRTLEVIDEQPERLLEVEGIGPVRHKTILAAWVEQREVRELMILLQTHGVSVNFAGKIWKTYRAQAMQVVQKEPYRLARDIYGIGFKTADRIAMSLGIAPDSPQRIQAGVLHMLEEAAGEGNVYLPKHILLQHASRLLEVSEEVAEEVIPDLAKSRYLVVEPLGHGEGEGIYLPALHTSELGAAGRLAALQSAPAGSLTIDVEKAIEWYQAQRGIALAREQQEALRQMVSKKFLVVTGGPGTGKTTLIEAMVRILAMKRQRIFLAAPTGRGARRMAELTGYDARTIHRLLEFNPKAGSFERNAGRPLEVDLLIVDEVSMVDITLFHNILKALPVSCRLLLVGDVDQLPSVGPGNVLRDLIQSESVDVVRLVEIFRQAKESRIVTNAHLVNQGEMPEVESTEQDSDFYFIEKEEPEEILAEIRALVAEGIPRRFGLDPTEDIQVLTPMHKGSLGASNLNEELGSLLNTRTESITRGHRSFRLGDKVMQIRNNYKLEVFNGDIGRIESIDEVNREVKVRYDERRVTYDTGDLDELVPAYASSIHKSQGSEYPCVVIPLHTQHYVMLQRNLLYTGITRGKRLVVIVGSGKAMSVAVRNNEIAGRFTRLAHRLRCAPMDADPGI